MDEENAPEFALELSNLPELVAEFDRRFKDREGSIDWEQLRDEQ